MCQKMSLPPRPARKYPPRSASAPDEEEEEEDSKDELLKKLIDCFEKIKELENELEFKTFKNDAHQLTISKLRQLMDVKDIFQDQLLQRLSVENNYAYNFENYYVNRHYTDISSHGRTIPDSFFMVPEGFSVHVVAPIGQCTQFLDSKKLFHDMKKGVHPRESDHLQGNVYYSGEVIFDVNLSFSDHKVGKTTFMNMGVFPYFARPIWIRYKQLLHWFEHRGEDGKSCKQLVEKIKETGNEDLDDVFAVEECMDDWLKNQGDLRYVLPSYRRNSAAREDTKLSLLLTRMSLYLKNPKNSGKFSKKIILDCCLGFEPEDTTGSKTARLVTQLEEFKENPEVIERLKRRGRATGEQSSTSLPCCFKWDQFMEALRNPPLRASSSIHKNCVRI